MSAPAGSPASIRVAAHGPGQAAERAVAESVRVRISDLADPDTVAAGRAARGGVANPTLCIPVKGPVGGEGEKGASGLAELEAEGVAPGAPKASEEAHHRSEVLETLGVHAHASAQDAGLHHESSSRSQRMEGATQVAGITPDGCMLPDGCLRFVAPSGGGWGIVRGALAVPESAMLFVSPRGCGRHGSIASLMNGYRHRVFYLDVPEEDFVMGGHVERAEQIVGRIMEVLPPSRRPKAFFICATCVDDLLGSDFDGVCDMCASRFGIPFSRCHMNPITRNSSTPPALNLQRSIYRMLWQPAAWGPDPMAGVERDEGAVNLVGGFVPVDAESELYGVLARAGMPVVRQLPTCENFDDFLAMRASRANIMLKAHTSLAVKDMEERLGIPYVRMQEAITFDRIAANYQALSDFLGMDLDTSEAEGRARQAEDEARGWLSGLSVGVGANLNGSSFEIALLLARLGAHIAFIVSDGVAPSEWPSVVALREMQPDIPVYPSTHPANSLYCDVPERADVGVGFDAASLAPGSKLVEFASDVEPFGYEKPVALLRAIHAALESSRDTREALYSKGLVV